jgi:hypothetical protein
LPRAVRTDTLPVMTRRKMHADEVETDVALVGRLLARQFPHWVDLPVTLVPSYGADHDIYRLGEDLAVRLPRIGWATEQAAKEALSWGLVIGAPKTLKVIGLRQGLEVQAARLAAEVIDTDALQELGVHLATMEANKASFEDFVSADMNFHQVVGRRGRGRDEHSHVQRGGPADAAPG